MGDEKKEYAILGRESAQGTPLLRIREDGSGSVGVLQPLKDGQPAPPGLEVVHLEHQFGNVYRVQTLVGGSGPAQVATKAYRDNYDSIFRQKAPDGGYWN